MEKLKQITSIALYNVNNFIITHSRTILRRGELYNWQLYNETKTFWYSVRWYIQRETLYENENLQLALL